MLKRIKNIWQLSRFHEENGKLVDDGKPKGQATIVDMSDPLEEFKNEEDEYKTD